MEKKKTNKKERTCKGGIVANLFQFLSSYYIWYSCKRIVKLYVCFLVVSLELVLQLLAYEFEILKF